MNLDDELRAAFERREPPPGFTERVLARVAAEGARKPRWRLAFPVWPMARWALAGGIAGLLIVAGVAEQRRRQGEIAKERVVLALHIASAKLNYAQRKVREVTLPPAAAMMSGIEERQ